MAIHVEIPDALRASLAETDLEWKTGDRDKARENARWLVKEFPLVFARFEGIAIEDMMMLVDASRGERPWSTGEILADPEITRLLTYYIMGIETETRQVYGSVSVGMSQVMRAASEALMRPPDDAA